MSDPVPPILEGPRQEMMLCDTDDDAGKLADLTYQYSVVQDRVLLAQSQYNKPRTPHQDKITRKASDETPMETGITQ